MKKVGISRIRPRRRQNCQPPEHAVLEGSCRTKVVGKMRFSGQSEMQGRISASYLGVRQPF